MRTEYLRHYEAYADAGRRRLSRPEGFCEAEEKCDETCRRRTKFVRAKLGAHSCRAPDLGAVQPKTMMRRATSFLLGDHRDSKAWEHLERVGVYHSPCPSLIQVLKMARNTNREVLRRTSSKRLLTINIVNEHDGYDRLCPFLHETKGPCREPGFFPRSKAPERRGRRRLGTPTCKCVAAPDTHGPY